MAGANLLDWQWELGDTVFGLDRPVAHEAEADPGSYSWRSQTVNNPSGDGRRFGVDLIEPGTWNFKLYVDVADGKTALEELGKVAKEWRGDEARKTPGAVMPLRYRMYGRTRRVYGRPRRFSAPYDNRLDSGYIPITADFEVASELFFDDAEDSRTLTITPIVTGGFEVPFETPLVTEEANATGSTTFVVGGELPTPLVAEIKGPVTDPLVQIDDDIRIQLTGTIAADTTIVIDARPWVMSIYRKADGAGIPGMLSRRTRLPRLLLAPGAHTVVFDGLGESSSTTATVRWRGAYPSV